MSGHCPGCGVYHEEDDNRKCAKCKAETMSDEALKALEHFFTVEEYVCLPGDRTAWYAINKASGIMCPGRDTFDLALQDAEALNAAVKRATEPLLARINDLENYVRALSRYANIVNVLRTNPIKYAIHLNGVTCGCCGISTFDVYEDDDGKIDQSKVVHGSNCMIVELRKAMKEMANATVPIPDAPQENAQGVK